MTETPHIMNNKEEILLIHSRMRRLLEELRVKGADRGQAALITDILADARRFPALLDRVTQHRAIRIRKAPPVPTLKQSKPWYKFW